MNKLEINVKIVVYHGEDDSLITAKDKYEVVKNIPNSIFNLIKKEDIDNIIFKSTILGSV